MYVWPLSGGPPRPQGVAVVQIVSPAYHTRLAFKNAAPTRGLVERAWMLPFARSMTCPTWLPCALSTEKAMWLPSGPAIGCIQAVPALTGITPPLGAHDWTPALVRKSSRAPVPAQTAIVPSVAL